MTKQDVRDDIRTEEENSELPSIPHNREAEESAIGSVLINPDIYFDMSQTLKAADFYIHRNRWIWEAFDELRSKNTPIDLLTVTNELERKGRLAEIGGPAYLTALVGQTPSSLNGVSYGEIVSQHSFRRKLISAANEIANLAYNNGKPISEMRDLAWQKLEGVTMSDPRLKGLLGLDSYLSRVYEEAARWGSCDGLPGVPTGFIDLDKMLGNLQAGDLIIVAGRPGQGKTGLLTDIVYHNGAPKSGDPKKIAVFSLEMSGESVALRILAKETGIDTQALRTGKLMDNEWPLFTAAIERLAVSGIFVDPTPAIPPPQILARARALKARYGLDLIVVDYLQLAEGHGDNRTQEVGYISRTLKAIARELDVPLIAAAQMNRAVESRGDKRPVLSDLRESGDIEQDSDVVMFIYYPDEKEKPNIARVIVAKQRNGPLGDVDLVFRRSIAKFESAETRYVQLPGLPDVEVREYAK